MQKLRVGIVGGGLITQVEHLPNLLALPDRFEVVGLADPSAKVRAHLSGRTGVPGFATADEVFALKPDAVVVATPDAYHADIIVQALERGLHVFTEKPLCYDVADARRVLAARDKAKRVVQVGYMKRFDPAYEALRELLGKRKAGALRSVTVDVVDSDAWAYTAHRDMVVGDDVPPALIEESRARRTAQVTAALGGGRIDPKVFRGFAGRHREIRLDVTAGLSRDLTRRYRAGELDIVVVKEPTAGADSRCTAATPAGPSPAATPCWRRASRKTTTCKCVLNTAVRSRNNCSARALRCRAGPIAVVTTAA